MLLHLHLHLHLHMHLLRTCTVLQGAITAFNLEDISVVVDAPTQEVSTSS